MEQGQNSLCHCLLNTLMSSQQPSDPQYMGTAFNPARTSPASWDAFSDVDAFVDAVLAELTAMAATKPTRRGPKPPLAGAALRKAIMAIWCVCFCGLQWRAIGQLCDIPFGTLYTLFARWTRVAPPAQPLDPGLAAGLRRYCRPQRRHHRQPILSVGTDLFRARLRWRQEDQGHQDPSRREHSKGSKANYGFPLAIVGLGQHLIAPVVKRVSRSTARRLPVRGGFQTVAQPCNTVRPRFTPH